MSAARRISGAPEAQPPLPDEILEEIFLRLDAAADLARASAACTSFRRLVSARRFLRRFRSLHSPPVLGFLDTSRREESRLPIDRFIPAAPPSSSAPAARALAAAADFTFSFLPGPCPWRPRHALDGRVVLSRRVPDASAFDDFVVCDPLHRRFVRIPPIPNDLTASMPQPGCMIKSFKLFLAPPDEDEEDDKLKDDEEVSPFRVICSVPFLFENKLMAFVFSSVNQKWQVATHHRLRSSISLCFYAHGCFFWLVILTRYALMLDTREMKFSTIDLPPNGDKEANRAIVDAGEGRLGLLTFGEGTIDLSCKVWLNNGVGAEEWQHYKIIHLPKDSDGNNYVWYIMGATEGYLSLTARQRDNYELPLQYFALDLKTFLFERLCEVNEFNPHQLYASLPPPLAPPGL